MASKAWVQCFYKVPHPHENSYCAEMLLMLPLSFTLPPFPLSLLLPLPLNFLPSPLTSTIIPPCSFFLLLRSLDELADHVSLLESRNPQPADSARAVPVAEMTNLLESPCTLSRGSPSEGEEEGEEPPVRNGDSKRKVAGTQKRGTKRPLGQKAAPSAKVGLGRQGGR